MFACTSMYIAVYMYMLFSCTLHVYTYMYTYTCAVLCCLVYDVQCKNWRRRVRKPSLFMMRIHKSILMMKTLSWVHTYISLYYTYTYILYTCIHGELWLCCAKLAQYMYCICHMCICTCIYMCFGSMCVCVWILLNMAISDAGF